MVEIPLHLQEDKISVEKSTKALTPITALITCVNLWTAGQIMASSLIWIEPLPVTGPALIIFVP